MTILQLLYCQLNTPPKKLSMAHPFQIISLPDSNSTENLQALAEVSSFGRTDMGTPGEGPWTYRILEEPTLTAELQSVCDFRSIGGWADVASFQPCLSHRSQDRFVVEEWFLPSTPPTTGSNRWRLCAVFDGHVTHATVDYVSSNLPDAIQSALKLALTRTAASPPGTHITPEEVATILRDCVEKLDNSISSGLLGLLPRNTSVCQLRPDDIKAIFPDNSDEEDEVSHGGAKTSTSVLSRALGGSTVLLSLTDLSRRIMWIANLGDGYAVLGQKLNDGWSGSLICRPHNVKNTDEVNRMKAAHPQPEAPIQNGRVLGYLEPTRAIGDTWLKLPAAYSEHVFPHFKQHWVAPSLFIDHSQLILTPPYVLGTPEVFHVQIPDSPCFILLCSDGLNLDPIDEVDIHDLLNRWTTTTGKALDRAAPPNMALALVRDAIGGDDNQEVSRNLTVEMDEPWLDDITVIVQKYNT
ncbi:protein serine/threonine phosphatase 2C [Pluteus cervinus]|uniref:Protein serine/threonine phosphatase 2C n=1 Tax=Pluteus cervinus TaxID=181527 RepID=A0ACD3BAW2_9AGAR|nr:protein serine/threonine phosphatase 2C [Pluteus cervinus]